MVTAIPSAMRGDTVKDYKPLLSSAPAHSILNAQAFHYTCSAATDIRKTFGRVRRRRDNANALELLVGAAEAGNTETMNLGVLYAHLG